MECESRVVLSLRSSEYQSGGLVYVSKRNRVVVMLMGLATNVCMVVYLLIRRVNDLRSGSYFYPSYT